MGSAASQDLHSSVAVLHNFLHAQGRLRGWAVPGATLSSGQGYELASMPGWKRRVSSKQLLRCYGKAFFIYFNLTIVDSQYYISFMYTASDSVFLHLMLH